MKITYVASIVLSLIPSISYAGCSMANCDNRTNPGSCDRAQAAYNACRDAEQAARARSFEQQKLDAARGAGTLNRDVNQMTTPPRAGNVGGLR